jgi:hypothetical protein
MEVLRLKDYTSVENQTPPAVNYHVDELGKVVTGANILVSGVLIGAMWFDHHSATLAAVSGIAYFGLSTSLTLLTLSGSLSQMVTNHQQQVTMRRYHVLQFGAPDVMQMALAHPRQVERSQDVDPMQDGNELPASTYVPAVANARQVGKEAALWAVTLYTEQGGPDPVRVSMKGGKEKAGRLRVASPANPEVKQFLLDRKVLEVVPHGYRLNVEEFPTCESLRWLMR